MVETSVGVGRTVADKYQIIELLGKGGMSNVWLARDERLGKLWAIKEIKPNTSGAKGNAFRQALVDEAHLMKRLDHPAIPRVVDMLDTGTTVFVVMDYVEGRSLWHALRERGGPFDQKSVISWGIQLCDVLGYLHELGEGIVYRDVKPSNVILREDGTIRLIDFGIAADKSRGAAQSARRIGTPGYAAPEQLCPRTGNDGPSSDIADIDGRADVFALGATMYTLVCGHTPHMLPDDTGATKISFDMRPIREWDPRLSEGLERIILRATRPDRAMRYQTMREMRYDLEHYEELTEQWRQAQRSKVGLVLKRALCALVCAAVGAGCLMGSHAAARASYESVMHEAATAQRTADFGTKSDAEKLIERAMALDETAVEPYELLLSVYEDDLWLDDHESLRLQKALGRALALEGRAGYARLCFDVGICYLSYYGTDKSGGSVGNSAVASMRAAAPWFDRALVAGNAAEAEGAGLSTIERQSAEAYRTIASFYNEVSRAGKEGRAAEDLYRTFWDALAHTIEREQSCRDDKRCPEGVRTRLCQAAAEVLASPTYLAGACRAGVGEDEAQHLLACVEACRNTMSDFAASDDYAEVYGPVFSEIDEEVALAKRNLLVVFASPAYTGQEKGENE